MHIACPQSVVCRLLIAGALAACAGCQYQAISPAELQLHQWSLNKSGLTALHVDSMLKITCAPPDQWEPLRPQNNMIYSHQQWRSPDRQVGMGVAYMRTPIPFSAQMIIWFARARYTEMHKNPSGRLLGQWNDSLGRCWFEAQDERYHVTGYAMTRGLDAWVVYSGYRVEGDPPRSEINLAAKAADSVAPLPMNE
jgi:hypothetical protein